MSGITLTYWLYFTNWETRHPVTVHVKFMANSYPALLIYFRPDWHKPESDGALNYGTGGECTGLMNLTSSVQTVDGRARVWWRPGGKFHQQGPSQYTFPGMGISIISRPSDLFDGNSSTGKTTSLYIETVTWSRLHLPKLGSGWVSVCEGCESHDRKLELRDIAWIWLVSDTGMRYR